MSRTLLASLALLCTLGSSLEARAEEEEVQAIISVADQRMVVLRDGAQVARYPVSTSRFGVGDACGSYKTPLGRLRVCDKVGDNLPAGTVFHHRQPTKEILPVNAPGRDPIVTRILWLDGCEEQNREARARSIYIHGTPEEKNIGKPVSWGCVRMRSRDVMALYEDLGVGAAVTVVAGALPRYPKYVPKPAVPTPVPTPEVLLAAKKAGSAPVPVATVVKLEKAAPHPAAATAPEKYHETTASVKTDKLAQRMGTSILLTGLDTNSEMPQLQR